MSSPKRKCGFQRTGKVQALTEDNADEGAEELQEMEDAMVQMRAPITYSEYASLDNVITTELQSIAGIVVDLTTADNKESDVDVEQEMNDYAAPTFADAMVALDTLRHYKNVHDCVKSERGLRLQEERLLQLH